MKDYFIKIKLEAWPEKWDNLGPERNDGIIKITANSKKEASQKFINILQLLIDKNEHLLNIKE